MDINGKEVERFWPPRPILGGILSTESSIKKETLKRHLSQLKWLQTIDIGCSINAYSFLINYNTTKEDSGNYNARSSASVHFYAKEIALVVFVYQLIHKLQQNALPPNEYSINVEAYLREVNPDFVQTPISAPLF